MSAATHSDEAVRANMYVPFRRSAPTQRVVFACRREYGHVTHSHSKDVVVSPMLWMRALA